MLKTIVQLVVVPFLVGTATALFANWIDRHNNGK